MKTTPSRLASPDVVTGSTGMRDEGSMQESMQLHRGTVTAVEGGGGGRGGGHL